MKDQDIIKAIAELDGVSLFDAGVCDCAFHRHSKGQITEGLCPNAMFGFKPYTSSRDAIVPVILKQSSKVLYAMYKWLCIHYTEEFAWILATPAQLSEVLLRAAGKWVEDCQFSRIQVCPGKSIEI